MISLNDLCIWWLDQRACEAIGGELPEEHPAYLRDEYRARLGRPGRGRLWVPRALDGGHAGGEIAVSPWPDNPMGRLLGEWYGGVVMLREHLGLVRDLPGVVTDLTLRRLA